MIVIIQFLLSIVSFSFISSWMGICCSWFFFFECQNVFCVSSLHLSVLISRFTTKNIDSRTLEECAIFSALLKVGVYKKKEEKKWPNIYTLELYYLNRISLLVHYFDSEVEHFLTESSYLCFLHHESNALCAPSHPSFGECDSIKCVLLLLFFLFIVVKSKNWDLVQWENKITQTPNHRIEIDAQKECLGLTKQYCLSI